MNTNTSDQGLLISDGPLPVAVFGRRPSTRAPAARPRFDFRRRLRAFRPGIFLASVFALFLLVASISPALLVSGDPLAANARDAFEAPSSSHVLGTDENGRDVLTRLVYGVRPSLFLGLAATAVGLGLGMALGLTAGLGHPAIDAAVMRFIDLLLAFPDLLLALLIITFWGRGIGNAIFAIGFASVPRYTRLVRAQTQAIRHSGYVEASVTLGLRPIAVIFRHVLPNAIKPAIILATIGIGGMISQGAALSFLGLGAPPPSPEWGSMLSVGRSYLSNAWWLTAVPATALTLIVISLGALARDFLRRSEGKKA
jgi:peptide/nickel transport system permease protein